MKSKSRSLSGSYDLCPESRSEPYTTLDSTSRCGPLAVLDDEVVEDSCDYYVTLSASRCEPPKPRITLDAGVGNDVYDVAPRSGLVSARDDEDEYGSYDYYVIPRASPSEPPKPRITSDAGVGNDVYNVAPRSGLVSAGDYEELYEPVDVTYSRSEEDYGEPKEVYEDEEEMYEICDVMGVTRKKSAKECQDEIPPNAALARAKRVEPPSPTDIPVPVPRLRRAHSRGNRSLNMSGR